MTVSKYLNGLKVKVQRTNAGVPSLNRNFGCIFTQNCQDLFLILLGKKESCQK